MNKQYVWALVAVLGLGGCGGGGGGDSDSPGASTGQVTAADLEGTWMWATENYEMSGGELEWASTRRQTFTITRSSNSVLRFKDCFISTTNNWNFSNGTVARTGQPTLTVVDEDTMTATSGASQIRLVRLSDSTEPVVAAVDIADINGFDVSGFAWSPVCIDTFVTEDPASENRLQLKVEGRDTDAGISGSLTLNFVSSGTFADRTIPYSVSNRADENITGQFSVNPGIPVTGNLSNPSGYVGLPVADNKIDMELSLSMESTSLLAPSVFVWGNIEFDAEWLALPETE